MANKENLYKNVKDLCTILNQYGINKNVINIDGSVTQSIWDTTTENASTTFLVEICRQPEAFKLLDNLGEITKRKICWFCGSSLSHLEYKFKHGKNNSIIFPICNKCYDTGVLNRKESDDLLVKSETFWGIPLIFSIGGFLYSFHAFTPGVDVEDYKLMFVSFISGIYFYYKVAICEEKNTFRRLLTTNRGNNVLLSLYIMWLFIHLIILFMSNDGYHSTSVFWPFQNDNLSKRYNELLNAYDFSEFLLYVGGPPVALLVYRLLYTKP